MTDRAVDILNRHDPVDINQRASQWREAGWTKFDVNAEPYRQTEADLPRESVSTGTRSERFTTMSGTDFDVYSDRFRNDFATNYSSTGYTYEQYQPAYRYGYDLARDERYREYDWTRLEPEARRYWDERNPGTWDRFKNAVRHAWEEIKDTVR
jgi:hypothetical protein